MKRLLRFRLAVLGVINGLIFLHVILYYAFDRTGVGCVDFFGLATFLGKGEITAGTIFLGVLIVLSLLLGRIFCGWGCHFALFQDLLVRLFDRVGVRLSFRRSRLELVLPPLLFFVTLLYPILGWWRHAGPPTNVTTDLAYPEVWHLLPGLKGVALILLVDTVVLTLLFGSRAFCRYVCPYGFFLKVFHALSPMRVVKTGDCSDCGSCISACPTAVPIKHEVERLDVVHDLQCMNCGDCVVACPEGALALKPTRSAYSRTFERIRARAKQPVWAEVILLATAVLGLWLYRGREYGDFLSVAMGLVAGAAVVVALNPARFIHRRLIERFPLGRFRAWVGAVAAYLLLGMVGQAFGTHALERARSATAANDYETMWQAYANGARTANVFRPFTFFLDDFHDRAERRTDAVFAAAERAMESAQWHEAELAYRTVVLLEPDWIAAHGNLGTALFKQGRFWDAARSYLRVLESDPNDMVALYHLAMTWIQLDELDRAAEVVCDIVARDTVGNAVELIRENPLFQLLSPHPTYRRAMAMYSPPGATNPVEPQEERQ